MTDPDRPAPERDPLAVIDALTPFRETLRGMVATLVADGFTDAQARDCVAALMRNNAQPKGEQS